MRVVLQRVTTGRVEVAGEVVGAVDGGSNPSGQALVALVGVTHDDGPEQVAALARKVADLRVLDGERSAADVGAPVLVVSQFTLYADTRKGRRPSWSAAAPGPVAEPLVDGVRGGAAGAGPGGGDGSVRRRHAGAPGERRPGHGAARGVARTIGAWTSSCSRA